MTTCLLLSSFINIYKPLYVCVKRVKLLKLRNLFCLSEGRRKYGTDYYSQTIVILVNMHIYRTIQSYTHTHTYSHRQEEVVDNAVRVAIVVVVLDPDPEREEAEIDELVEGLDQGREGGVDLDQEGEGEADLDPERREEEEDDSRRI